MDHIDPPGLTVCSGLMGYRVDYYTIDFFGNRWFRFHYQFFQSKWVPEYAIKLYRVAWFENPYLSRHCNSKYDEDDKLKLAVIWTVAGDERGPNPNQNCTQNSSLNLFWKMNHDLTLWPSRTHVTDSGIGKLNDADESVPQKLHSHAQWPHRIRVPSEPKHDSNTKLCWIMHHRTTDKPSSSSPS